MHYVHHFPFHRFENLTVEARLFPEVDQGFERFRIKQVGSGVVPDFKELLLDVQGQQVSQLRRCGLVGPAYVEVPRGMAGDYGLFRSWSISFSKASSLNLSGVAWSFSHFMRVRIGTPSFAANLLWERDSL